MVIRLNYPRMAAITPLCSPSDMAWIATFHSHFGALNFQRRLRQLGDSRAEIIPAPRRLSISCGSAVRFHLSFDPSVMVDEDTDGVFLEEDGHYRQVFSND